MAGCASIFLKEVYKSCLKKITGGGFDPPTSGL